jgi:hypothetical protein
MELNENKNLENQLSSDMSSDMPTISMPADSAAQATQTKTAELQKQPQISQDEETGIHKGAINTLLAERNELLKMLSNVEVIMQAHISRLKELGVEIEVKQPEENSD